MTKEIQLTRGQVTVVDDEDYEYLMQWKWCARTSGKHRVNFYAKSDRGPRTKVKTFHMHREVAARMGLDLSGDIDHKDRNTLNNRRSNLRPASKADTAANRSMQSNNTSGFIGVYHYKRVDKWTASIQRCGEQKHLGYFESPILAAIAYNNAARELHGEFAVLNVIPNPQPHE